MTEAVIEDIKVLNDAIRYLKDSESRTLRLWKYKSIDDMMFAGASDAAGPGTASKGGTQGAYVLMVSGRKLERNEKAKTSILSWKSQKLKRAVASTLAGEALALSLLLAELEFIQFLFREMTRGDVKVHDPEEALMRYVPMVSSAAQLREYQRELALVDAKSVYDTCQNSAVQGKQDKRTAIEALSSEAELFEVDALR